MPVKQQGEVQSSIRSGDWAKSAGERCTTQWDRVIVTESCSNSDMSVDGVLRHILDARPVEGLTPEDKVEYEQPETVRKKTHSKGPKGIDNHNSGCVIIVYVPEGARDTMKDEHKIRCSPPLEIFHILSFS